MLILKCCGGLWEAGQGLALGCLVSPSPIRTLLGPRPLHSLALPWAPPVVFAACRASDELKHPLPFPK